MKDKKRLLLAVLIIVAVGGGTIAATTAFFTARRTVSQSQFTVGTLDMSVTGSNNTLNEPFVIENIGADGDISGSKTWTIKNTGTLPGRFLVKLQSLQNLENGCNDQEKETEPACEANTEGELGGVVNLKVTYDGQERASSTLATANEAKIGNDWNALAPLEIAAGQEKTITFSWSANEDAYGNEIQSDSLKFDTLFRLIQINNGPTPTN